MANSAARQPFEHEKSVRLTTTQVERLERASRAAGVRASDLIREAIDRRCDELLGRNLADELEGYIGVLNEPTARPARQSREVFGEVVDAKLARRRKQSPS